MTDIFSIIKVNCKKGPASDKPAFSAWIQELSAAFRARDPPLLLTAAVSPNKKVVDEGMCWGPSYRLWERWDPHVCTYIIRRILSRFYS